MAGTGEQPNSTSSRQTKKKRFGSQAVKLGFCSEKQIEDAVKTQEKLVELGLPQRIGEILNKKGHLSKNQVNKITETQRDNQILAGFEIIEKVGQGGMGAVFRARQISMDRVVALKILPKQLAKDPKYKERFLREARLSAKLSHPNLLAAIDVGEASGYMYYAMEFVEGKTLRQLQKEQNGALPLNQCLDYIRQTAEGLKYAHGKNLIHRDIKPDNIMLDSFGKARVCDLGLARKTGLEESDADLTTAGKAVGTPHYISPEQAQGLAKIDQRTDIYSLGATMYHLLSGKTLFKAQAGAAIMAMHIRDEAPALNAVQPEIPAGYAMIVSKMLAKDPAQRYADMGEVLKDLNAVRNGQIPDAQSFKSNSSCKMPKSAGRSDRMRRMKKGATTGPRLPIGARGTTGPRKAIGPKNTTGPVKAIGPMKVITSPVSPIGAATTHRDQEPKTRPKVVNKIRKRNSPALAGVAAAVVVVLVAIIALMAGPKNEISNQDRTARKNKQSLEVDSTTRSDRSGTLTPTRGPKAKGEPPSKSIRPLEKHTSEELDRLRFEKRPEPSAALVPSNKQAPSETRIAVAPPETLAPQPKQKEQEVALPTQGAPQMSSKRLQPETKKQAPPHAAASKSPAKSKAEDPRAPILLARWLNELIKKAPHQDLSKSIDQLRDLASQTAYRPIQSILQRELEDLDRAVQYETRALKALAEAGGALDLPEQFAKNFGVKKGKITGFDPRYGIAVNLKGAGISIKGFQIPVAILLQAAGAKKGNEDSRDAALYCIARGAFPEARNAVAQLTGEDKKNLSHKLELLKAGEKEVAAQIAFTQLKQQYEHKQWKTLKNSLAEYRQAHAETKWLQEHSEDAAVWQADLEKALAPPNPWKNVFHAAKVVTRKDGFVEVLYDFSKPEQLQDWSCQHAKLQFKNGYVSVPKGGGEWSHARFMAPFAEIESLEAIGKTDGNAPRFGVYMLMPKNLDGTKAPRCMLRRYNQRPHIEQWDGFSKKRQGPIPGCNAIGSSKENWKIDTRFTATVQGKTFSWKVNDRPVGSANLPDRCKGGQVALISVDGQHSWRLFRMVFKPEPAWAKQKLADVNSGGR